MPFKGRHLLVRGRIKVMLIQVAHIERAGENSVRRSHSSADNRQRRALRTNTDERDQPNDANVGRYP